ncbi:MAG: carboxypeptidase regulatory-like domain-containing protein [Acidobacteriia bacterium]|nr:carboxypeptidase regulatory-like domain-containing protein [Terriglobia bacterium]
MKLTVLATIVMALSAPAFSQEFRATISGVVTDPTGAMIAGSKITIVETQTKTRVETATDESGQYVAPLLLPGMYEIAVKQPGFKEAIRKNVRLGAGEHPVIDFRLEVGEAATTVEVAADVPLINTENASVGQAIHTKEIEDLPSNGGTPYMLASLSLGVVAQAQPSTVQPFASGGAASWSIGGMPSQTNELLVDGSPNATWDGRLAYSPPMEAVSEVRVKAFDTDASYGHSGAGTVNTILRSGTNALHGALYEKQQPTNMTANTFFNNAAGQPPTVTHFNQFGGTAGGPVFIPKAFDGRNRLFWYFAFEGLQDSNPNTTLLTVPTDAERQGDFSKLLSLSSPTIIYDPLSAVLSGTTIKRTAYTGNKIPASSLSPIARQMLGYYPAPIVTALTRADDYQNFVSNSNTTDGYTNEFGRLDINWSDSNRSYFNVRHTDYSQAKNDYFRNIATGSNLSRSNWGLSLDHVLAISATNMINVRANFTRMFEDHSAPSAGFDPATLGFPSYLAGNSQYLQLPYLQFASNSFSALGMNGANTLPSQSLQLFGTWVAIRGRHQIKIGGDLRQYRLNYRSYGNATGNLSFSSNAWVRAASNASSTVALGQDFAEFLVGLPTSGSYDVNASAMFYSYYAAGFAQDDWRIGNTLSVNLGLRFDHDFPYHEKWGRSVNGFAFDTPNPLAPAAIAAYNASTASQMPAGAAFGVPGGLTFASPGDNAIFQNTSHLVSPRLGFAWSPARLSGKTVINGGFAMFVAPITIALLQSTGAYSTNPILTQEGYSQSTPFTASNDNNLTPYGTLANPFPGGIQQPAGSSKGLLTYVGQAVNFINPEMKSPYSVRWNFGVRHQLTPNTALEIVYMGNHGVHLPVTYTQLNGVPRQYLSTLGYRDQPVINTMTATVNNPFNGLVTTGTPTGKSTNVAQLTGRYPEFPLGYSSGVWTGGGGVYEQNVSIGSSYYQALNVGLNRRVSRGLNLRLLYMRTRMVEQVTWLNDTDPLLERRISPFDHPHRFVTAVVYDIPVGQGRALDLQSRWANAITGGWSLTSTYTFQTGQPILWMNGSTNNPGDYVYFGAPLNLDNRAVGKNAFDTTAFDVKSANAFQYHVRTFPTTFQSLRQDGINDWNASLGKTFDIRESTSLRIQCDAFNVVNHPTFAAPNAQASATGFGQITSQANRTRMLQLWARLRF